MYIFILTFTFFTNIAFQEHDESSHKHYQKKYEIHHSLAGYQENESFLMTQQKITENDGKLKRNSFSFNQIDNETRDSTFTKQKDDADGLSQNPSFQIQRKHQNKTKNHLTS